MAISIKFLGAAETVTGSSFLVKGAGVSFIVDCGMFQGKEVEDRNNEDFDFDPKEIDFVIITHAHIDHIGLLPKLVKQGFSGPIYATSETISIAYHLLLDAAKIQEKNFQKGLSVAELYNTTDALKTIDQFRAVAYEKVFASEMGVDVKFKHVGHVAGAASVFAKVEGKTIVFSGDIGRSDHPFLFSFEDSEDLGSDDDVSYIVMEALYGGEAHQSREETEKLFLDQVVSTLEGNGNVMIPAFALQRTQEILNILKRAYLDRVLPSKYVTYLDSPLAIKVTEEYSRINFSGGINGSELFKFDRFRFVESAGKVIRRDRNPKIIIAGSGMCHGGRILGHLRNGLPRANNSVMIVGYQAEDTLGRELVDGAKEVVINNKKVKVNAKINRFYGFSAHADTNDLDLWLKKYNTGSLKKVFLVHSETQRAQAYKRIHRDISMYIPSWKEEVVLA